MAKSRDTAFLGHPSGLGWLSGSEFWERFSYYGMQTLLVLYMTHYLLQPGHVEHIWGFVPFRGMIESFYGPLSPAAMASVIYGLYAGLVYLTPLGGGLLADRLTGRTAAVTLGALLMAAGHFLMAFEVSFLVALLCLLIGVGCFKGNIAAQVGDLYAEDDPRRADAFQIYYLAIQIAVIISPLVCSTLGETVGWHWGFGAAGVGMLIGLAIYLIGRPALPKERRRGGEKIARPPLTARDMRAVVLLSLLIVPLAVALIGNQEMFNAYLIWAQAHFQTHFFGMNMPIGWIISLDAIISTATIAGSVMFWRWYGTRWAEPDEITKVTIGVGISALAPLTLAAASMVVAATGRPVSLGWALAFHLLNDIGFSNVLPVALALYTRAAPKGLEGLMIAVYYLQFFLGNMLVGYVGSLYEAMAPANFWLLHVALMLLAGAVLLAVRRFAGKVLAPPYAPPKTAA
jgi:POT family proton-dependent oligopeptide transporter